MWVPGSATLIYGEKDAVLVDTLLTIEQANALVEWVAVHGKNVTTIYAGHKKADRDDSPRIIEETRQYIRDFERLAEATTTARELYAPRC